MTEKITIALDVMGGDHGVDVVLPAAKSVLEKRNDIELLLVGDEAVIKHSLAGLGLTEHPGLKIRHASQHVEMDELASHALRFKKDSSMRVAINMVKEGHAQACVSAGNTGALMATARYVLKTLPGIDRPAICTSLPSMHGHTWMLDLGANIDSTPEQLFQFALMGSVLASALDHTETPRVGLLNVGEEEMKGNETVKEAANLLSSGDLNYVGFVEGTDVYCGDVDVVVCDGFVGNIALKTSEGVAKMIAHFIKKEFTRNILTRIAALFALPVLKAFRRQIDPRRYNGASLLGLRGSVIKSHGGADILAFSNAINVAAEVVEQNVPERIKSRLQIILSNRQAG
ncbi:phosphate:acyl-[acyl carrier protein] acyltransferase [Thiogranum longum]|uniref:Phosphate acyltransferase n=1 Tax=Thiogranum longum TaxID=1537524 RepID=A0A4R1H8X9_9GAMM|nr:phosphate acyltransferase PlsX [Thiogranum longum]TCK18304.1 phosphate:acyl-[acyl carrier protein] acyltransferase [Thiogranum longum]